MSDNNSVISSLAVSRRSLVSLLSSQLSVESNDDGSMLLPPKGYFPSFKDLESYAQNYAQRYGYVVISIR